MKVNHIGYLVENIEEGIQEFLKLGYFKLGEVIKDQDRKIYICFLKNEDTVVELVSPIDETSVVYEMHKKFRNMPYHICYEAEDLEATMREYRKQGFIIVQPVAPAIAFDNRKVVFLFNKSIGLIEIVEKII